MHKRRIIQVIFAALLPMLTGCSGLTNPETPVGHRGYVYSRPMIMGGGGYVETMKGPSKLGTSWRKFVINVDVRPQPFNEHFKIRMRDNLNVEFDVTLKANPDPDRVQELVEQIGENWYERYIKPEFTTICRKVISRYDSEKVTQMREQIAQEILLGAAAGGESMETKGLQAVVEGKPIQIHSIVVGNIDFPDVVDQEIERKLAKQQELEKQATQLEIAKKEAQIKVEEAKGIAESQKIINKTLTPSYLQHEAIITTEKLAKAGKMNFYFVPTSPNGMGMPLVLNNQNAVGAAK